MTIAKSTPLAVFAYNRPRHLSKTLHALSKCRRIQECLVFIYCDGSNNPKHDDLVEETRIVAKKYAKMMGWLVVERSVNLGCDQSIINEVTKLCKDFGRVIVIEDDIYVSPAFISFMLESLDHYENNVNVYQIAGFSYSNNRLSSGDSFFIPLTNSWGWATWERAWKSFKINYEQANNLLLNKKFCHNFDLNGSYPYSHMLQDDISRIENKWDIWWYFSVFLNRGLVLYPVSSIVYNIGFDSSGLHCGNENFNAISIKELENFDGRNSFTFPNLVQIDHSAFNSYQISINLTLNNKKINNSIRYRTKEFLKSLLKKLGLFDNVKEFYLRKRTKKNF